MRIIAGKLKGSKLELPISEETRPLKDMARESIFNLLNHSNKMSLKLEKANVLDLYAGVGSFGLECLSRKAKSVYFVENSNSAFKILQKNIEKLKVKQNSKTFLNDVFDFVNTNTLLDKKFNLIFCDPPFNSNRTKELIELIFYKKLLIKNGILILHRNENTKENYPNFFNIIDQRIYGISKIIFGKLII